QDEKDVVMNEQWKAGKISDKQWLAYIESRISRTAEFPDQQVKWKQLFLQTKDSITDAQFEANYAIGKVSLGALIDHYRQRMAGVQENSPGWRDLATRYGQLINARSSGGGGSGCGRGGS